jgi:hypothetical protein
VLGWQVKDFIRAVQPEVRDGDAWRGQCCQSGGCRAAFGGRGSVLPGGAQRASSMKQ